MRSGALALALAAALLRAPGPSAALRVYDERGRPLATLAAGEGFSLSYVHSVNLSPVDEFYCLGGDGTIRLERMLFDQLSSGMPSGEEDGFAVSGGRFAATPNRSLPEIAIRVSPVTGHGISVGGAPRPLTRWAEVGGLLLLRPVSAEGGRRGYRPRPPRSPRTATPG
jgi:hypothetical protein